MSISWPKSERRGAAPVIAYKVESWERGGESARWTEVGVSPLNCVDVFKLKPEAEYQFRVTPRNRYGWGEPVCSDVFRAGRRLRLPEFSRTLPWRLRGLRGGEAVLECQVEGDPEPTVRWYRDGAEIPAEVEEEGGRVEVSKRGGLCSLAIRCLEGMDEGRYTCEASNRIGRVSTFSRLTVVDAPEAPEAGKRLLGRGEVADVGESPPQFSMRLRDRRVQAFRPVRLTCQVVGCPKPEVLWSKDGEVIRQDGKFFAPPSFSSRSVNSDRIAARHLFYTDEDFHTLEISRATLDDCAVYGAMASNVYGSVSCGCRLTVDRGVREYLAPEFARHLEPSAVTLQEGSELRLCAKVEAYPSVGLTWYRNGVRLRPSRRAAMTASHGGRVELALASLTRTDSGVYTCVAANEVGRAESSSRVLVSDARQAGGGAEGREVAAREEQAP